MLQFIISGRVQKSKQNVQAYLNTSQGQPKESIQSGQVTITNRASTQPSSSTYQLQNTANTNTTKSKANKNQYQLKSITVVFAIAQKTYTAKQKQSFTIKFNKQENQFQVVYSEQGVKNRIDMKRESILAKKIKPNLTQGICTIQSKLSINRKQDYKDGIQKWSNGKQNTQTTIIAVFKQKQQLKTFIQSPYLQGLVDSAVSTTQIPKNIQINGTVEQGNQMQQQHINVKLTLPGPQKQGQVDKIRKIIKQMKEEDKNTVLMQVFKIKKEYDDPTSTIKKLKCPVVVCQKSYKDIQQLKSHLKQKHPQLSKHGIQLSQYDGTLDYGYKAMDLALFIGKMYPDQMKKLIKQTKSVRSQE